MKNNSEDVFHDRDFDPMQMEKLQLWKNQTLIEEDYFEKFQTCVQQRIRMNKEIQRIDIPSKKKPTFHRGKYLLPSVWIGIAALFVLMFLVFYPEPQVKKDTASIKVLNPSATEKKTLPKDSMDQPHAFNNPSTCSLEQIADKEKTENVNWEVAMQQLSDEELEAMVWELDWEETF